MQDHIYIKGARENNLKNIDVTIPRDKLVVLTGLSGSGKSSLAFDTIYAEGQRRYVESLSSYARMFLGQMDKPDVDYIDGLSPAISIDQKTTSKNPRSTVGTVTEIYDYLRLLWARIGTPHCPKCGKEIRQQTIDQIIDQILALPEGTRIQVLAPVVRGRKGEHAKVLEDARRSGYVRVRADGSLYDLSEDIPLEKNKKHHIEIVVDRLIVRPDLGQRLTDSVETASHLSGGIVIVNLLREEQDLVFSQNYACDDCGISIEELTPRMFSFNNPYGACPTCTGLGMQLKADPALIIPDDSLSILDGAITASGWNSIRSDGISRMYFEALSKKYQFSLRTPVRELPESVRQIILYGTGGEKLELHYDQPRGKGVLYQPFEGVANNLERRYQETQSDASKREIEEFMSQCPCPACQSRRLKPEALAVTVGGLSIWQATELPVDEELAFFNSLTLTETQQLIAAQILKESRSRLGFLQALILPCTDSEGRADVHHLQLYRAVAPKFVDLQIKGRIHPAARRNGTGVGGDGEENTVELAAALAEPQLQVAILAHALQPLQRGAHQAEERAGIAGAVGLQHPQSLHLRQGDTAGTGEGGIDLQTYLRRSAALILPHQLVHPLAEGGDIGDIDGEARCQLVTAEIQQEVGAALQSGEKVEAAPTAAGALAHGAV